MFKDLLFIITVLTLTIQCKKLKEQSKQPTTVVDSQILFDLINKYREETGNITEHLRTGLLSDNALFGMAKSEVLSMYENHSFGQHQNYNIHSQPFSSYSEIICKLRNAYGNVYKHAFEFWMKNPEISEELKQNYEYADAYCMQCDNHWLCALMLANN